MKNEDSASPTPIIFIHEHSRSAYSIFNLNEWSGDSKLIIMSCAAQYSLMHYSVARIRALRETANVICQTRFLELRKQWENGHWELGDCRYLVEVPEAHLHIQAFLVTVKALLDLLSQLVATEGVVNKKVHGFHKKGYEIGGELLHIMEYKAYSSKADLASRLQVLVKEHKRLWIDQIIACRDGLTHPKQGYSLVMYELEVRIVDRELVLIQIAPPLIDGLNFEAYIERTMPHIEAYCRGFLQLLRDDG